MIAGSTGALILLSNIFASCSQVRPYADSNTNVRFSLRWKCQCRLCTVQLLGTGSFTKSIDFPETNYPGVRDLTHKFRAAVGFSDFNHTSMLAPQSNLHCLSQAPALCQLFIDYYPALALYCDSSLSVPVLRLSPWLCHCRIKTARRDSGSGEQKEREMISAWNSHRFWDFLMPFLSLLRERVSQWSGFNRTVLVCKTVKAFDERGAASVGDSQRGR